MSNKIAVLANNSNAIYAFQKMNDLMPKDFTSKYYWVQSVDDVSGRLFAGYIKIWSWEEINGLKAIMDHFDRHNILELFASIELKL